MAIVPAIDRRSLTRVALLALVTLGLVATGCASLPHVGWWEPTTIPVCHVVALWENRPREVPDSTNGGSPLVGLAGKVYLMDKDNVHALAGEGRLIVEMYDETSGHLVPVERWDIHPNDFRRLGKKDMLGWTYIIFLPSQGLRPEMARVRLRTAFHPEKGTPVFADSSVTLAPCNGVMQTSTVPLNPTKASVNR